MAEKKYLDFCNVYNVGCVIEAWQRLNEITLAELEEGRLDSEQWEVLRKEVLRRDGYRCGNCNAENMRLDVHHIVPVSAGGSNRLTNLKTLCFDCHCKIHPHMVKAEQR